MVQLAATMVDGFFGGVERERVVAIRQLRSLCQELLIGWIERMQWGMPG